MRTTVTLDPDVDALLKTFMRERGLSFKQGVNQALRLALTDHQGRPPERMPTYRMGVRPGVNLDKALQLAGELEDEHFLEVTAERARLARRGR